MSEAAPIEPEEPLDGETFAEEVEQAGTVVDFDPVTGKPRTKLEKLNAEIKAQEGTAVITSVKQTGSQDARYVIDVESDRYAEPFRLKSLTETQLDNMAHLSRRIRSAGGGYFPRPRQGSEKWQRLTQAIVEAADFEEHGATEYGAWARRIAIYADGRCRSDVDPTTAEGKVKILGAYLSEVSGAIEAPDGRLWLHAGSFLEFLSHRRIDADEATVQAALRQLGFESKKITARVDGKTRGRNFWRSPEGFDWRSEA